MNNRVGTLLEAGEARGVVRFRALDETGSYVAWPANGSDGRGFAYSHAGAFERARSFVNSDEVGHDALILQRSEDGLTWDTWQIVSRTPSPLVTL